MAQEDIIIEVHASDADHCHQLFVYFGIVEAFALLLITAASVW